MASSSPSRQAVETIASAQIMEEAPSSVLVHVLGHYQRTLETFIRGEQARLDEANSRRIWGSPTENTSREWYSACAALNLLTTLQERFAEFKVGEPLEGADHATYETATASLGVEPLTLETLGEFLEGHVVPLAMVIQDNLSKGFLSNRVRVFEAKKEMRYGDEKWGPARIALDAASNHTPSDSGGTRIGIVFELAQPGGGSVMVDVGEMESPPNPTDVLQITIDDDGEGYPPEEIARENPTKRGARGKVGQHGEGLIMAALASVRRAVGLKYASGEWEGDAIAFPQPDDSRKPRAETTHGWYLSYLVHTLGQSRAGSSTTFRNPTPELVRELFNLRENLLCYTLNEVIGFCRRAETPGVGVEPEEVLYGEVRRLLPGRTGTTPENRIYIKGVYSTHRLRTPLLFSYNLFIDTPRDRDYIPDLDDHLLAVFRESCTEEMAAAMLGRATFSGEGGAKWTMNREGYSSGEDQSGVYELTQLLPMLEGNCPPQMQRVFAEAFRKVHGPEAVLATNSEATQRFHEQHTTTTRGKKLVLLTKNMATFLQKSCGVPMDWDVVQFPREAETDTSLVLESVDLKHHGLGQALIDLLRAHHQHAGGAVNLRFRCQGRLVTLDQVRQQPELGEHIEAVVIHTAGQDDIQEGALRLQVGQTSRRGTEAVHNLPDAITALLACGVRPTLSSGRWQAVAEVRKETTGKRELSSVAYRTDRYPTSRFPGFQTVLEPREGERLSQEVVDALLSLSKDVSFLEPERYGHPTVRDRQGAEIWSGGRETGIIFVDGIARYRLPNARYNVSVPARALAPNLTDSNSGLNSSAQFHMRNNESGTWVRSSFETAVTFYAARLLAEHLPRQSAEAVQVVRAGLTPITDESQLYGANRPSSEARLLRLYTDRRKDGWSFYQNDQDPEDALDAVRKTWDGVVSGVIQRDLRLDPNTVVVQDLRVPSSRTVARSVGDLWEGARTEFSRSDRFRNATECHGRLVVAPANTDMMSFLAACGFPLDSALPMEYVPFEDRHPIVTSTLRRTSYAVAALMAATLLGRGVLETADEAFSDPSRPEPVHDIFRLEAAAPGLSTLDRIDFDLMNLLKSILAGLGVAGGVAIAGIGTVGTIDGLVGLYRRHQEGQKRTQRVEADRASAEQLLQDLRTLCTFLDTVCGTHLFGAVVIQPSSRALRDVAEYNPATRTLLVAPNYLPSDPTHAAGDILMRHVLPILLKQIPAEQKVRIQDQILTGTLAQLVRTGNRGPQVHASLTQVGEAWKPASKK